MSTTAEVSIATKKILLRRIILLISLSVSLNFLYSATDESSVNPRYGIVEQTTIFELKNIAPEEVDLNHGNLAYNAPGNGVQIANWSFRGNVLAPVEICVKYDELKAQIGSLLYKIPYTLFNGSTPVESDSCFADLVRQGDVYYEADNNGVISVKRTTRAIYPDVAQYSSTIIFLLCSH
ncbi:MAG: hypothetical protein PHU24_03635 [Sphaerochaetaceae bacterium]|jgi:hypothetical protein|nr:hypothetical protein [Sphaerochaetaceae bacterium]MDD4840500.1 hypothetical protein [Sphaerochaetaceae bacterium]